MKRRRRLACGALALTAVSLPGCYRHVVGAKGYGASGTTVYEPSIQEPGKEQKTPIQRKPPRRMSSHE